MFYGYRSDISSSYMYHQCGVKKRLDKKRNVYHCRLLSREFSPFPLTEENAKIIGEGIFIADRL